MTSDCGARYLHGTSPEEHQRLTLLNDLLNEASLRELGLRAGERILDVGCGLAQLSRAMARVAGPSGYVLGIDQSAEQLAEATRLAQAAGEEQLVELRQGDAVALPLRREEWGSFETVHARFILEHVPEPMAVVRAMVRAARSGGRIVLQDDDHDVLRLWPEPPGVMELWRAYIQAFARNGNDPHVGRRLVSLLYEAGAAPVRNTCVFWGSCAGSPTFSGVVANLIGLLEGARRRIAPAILDEPRFEEAIQALKTWSARPDVALWFAVPWAEGVRRT